MVYVFFSKKLAFTAFLRIFCFRKVKFSEFQRGLSLRGQILWWYVCWGNEAEIPTLIIVCCSLHILSRRTRWLAKAIHSLGCSAQPAANVRVTWGYWTGNTEGSSRYCGKTWETGRKKKTWTHFDSSLWETWGRTEFTELQMVKECVCQKSIGHKDTWLHCWHTTFNIMQSWI